MGGEDEGFSESVIRRLRTRQADSGKTCATCGVEKPLGSFGADTRNRDGLHRQCRSCRAGQVS